MRIILLGIFLLTGCSGKRMMHGVDMNNLSGSPCVDGTIYNIERAGCEVFYWGQTERLGLKLRCTYSDHDNFYTNASFYVVPLSQQLDPSAGYIPWCIDSQAMVYTQLLQQ